jgi:hypothetical protein
MSTVHEIKVAALKRELAVGIEDLIHGRFRTYNDTNIMQLADDVSRSGFIRLNALRLKVAAKVHGKK